MKNLPQKVQQRVKALKNYQLQFFELESKFFEEIVELEKKYRLLYEPIFEKRRAVITGQQEPPPEETVYQSEEEDEEMSENFKQMAIDLKKSLPKHDENVAGIPDFWLTVFKSTEIISDMIQPHDAPILKHLQDVKVVHDDKEMAYTLVFEFTPNEYFKDATLTKKYFLRTEVDKEEPYNFEGPEIFKCTGCDINWNPGKNVTIKTIKKKQKHKARGAVRTITKQVPNDSFFNFFSPPIVTEESKLDDESQGILATDFEIGHFLKARIIPKAVYYFTGDIVDDEDEDEEEEEEGSEEETDEDHSDDEGGKPNPGAKKAIADGQPTAADCKQQ